MNRSGNSNRALRGGIGALVVLVASALMPGAAAAMVPDTAQPTFRAIAHELLSGIGSASLADIPAAGGYGKPRIAVAPLRTGKDAVPASVAEEFNDWLLSELTHQGGRHFRFVARDALKSIIRDIDTIDELEKGTDSRVVDLLRNARVDILIVGRLHKEGDAASVSYKAVGVENGIVFAATQPRLVWFAAPPRAVSVAPSQPTAVDDDTGPAPPRLLPAARRHVWRVQRMLVVLGYDPGPVDGLLRSETRQAIRDFERETGVAVTGRVTRILVSRLRRALRAEGKTALALP